MICNEGLNSFGIPSKDNFSWKLFMSEVQSFLFGFGTISRLVIFGRNRGFFTVIWKNPGYQCCAGHIGATNIKVASFINSLLRT